VATSGTTTSTDFRRHEAQDCADADHLGVVFVHGVGFQNRGETLLSWSDRLIRVLAARYGDADEPVDRVHRSEIDLDGSEPSSIELRIPGRDGRRPQHWLLAEAFWAASIQPPSVPTMLRWLGARGAAALAAVGPAKAFRNSVYLTGVVIGALVLYAAIRSLTALLPIAAVRNALVAPLDRLLTGWSGDMQVLVFDAAQSANIRTRVYETITGVADAGFARVAVVAHSGGAVASYMTLTDGVLWQPTASRPTAPAVVTLITLGQGLNIAWRLSGVGDGKDCSRATGTARRLTADLRLDHRQLRWYDYYSEGDTVSESLLRPPACLVGTVPGESDRYEIQNVPANPHGTYWDNDEEFVLPIVRRLEAAAPIPAEDEVPAPLPPPDSSRLARRMLRIGMASLTTRVMFAAMASAIVGSALLGGARMDDLGAALAEIITALPLVGLLAGPRDWIAENASGGGWDVLRALGTLVISLLLVLTAFLPLSRLGPDRLALQIGGARLQRRLIRVVDGAAAILPLAAVAAWLGLALRGDPNAAPTWAVLGGLLLAGIGFGIAVLRLRSGQDGSLLRRLDSAARSGLGVMAIVGVLAVIGAGTVLVIVADAEYGGTSLGAAILGAFVVYVLYRLLGGVATWRWQAWDEQEREQFRQTLEPGSGKVGERPWGRRVDVLVIGFACVAAIVLAAAIGAPIIGTAAAIQAAGVVVLIVVVIWMIGAGQDAANGPVEPSEVAPLPTAAA
jgi:hypothetical protein